MTPPRRQGGFTLVEVAIAIVILGLLLGSAVLMLGAQIDLKNSNETRRTLESARDAIYGFAVTNGRLPCPAAGGATGLEAIPGGVCSNELNGFVPALTLGLSPTDANGYLLDAWGNRVRYAVTSDTAFTTDIVANQLSSLGIANLAARPTTARGLTVCSIPGPEPAGCAVNDRLADQAVAMILSSGRNGPAGASADELNNIDNGRFFLDRQPSPTFDDQLLWISRFTLYNRMLVAGAL